MAHQWARTTRMSSPLPRIPGSFTDLAGLAEGLPPAAAELTDLAGLAEGIPLAATATDPPAAARAEGT